MLFDAVDGLSAKNMADYHVGFEFAFQQFEKFNETEIEGSQGADCNRVIMFLTDGGTDKPVEVFKKYNWPEKRVSLRLVR